MRKITIVDNGKQYEAFTPEDESEIKEAMNIDRKKNIREHLYMGYLIIGTIAFTLGILISVRRLNGKA
tara:strand:+ start:102 stop:305 length:204 start_codon:yes stop_codon:yes gene_type:complete